MSEAALPASLRRLCERLEAAGVTPHLQGPAWLDGWAAAPDVPVGRPAKYRPTSAPLTNTWPFVSPAVSKNTGASSSPALNLARYQAGRPVGLTLNFSVFLSR